MQKKSIPSDLEILDQLPLKVDLLLLSDRFSHYKSVRKKIFDLTKKGYLELLSRGHYLNLKSSQARNTSPESIANALYFPSYVSSEWALQFYGLLTDRVYTVTSVTSRKSAYFKTKLGNFAFDHIQKNRYPIGYVLEPENGFLIARPEKALLDYLKLRGHDMTWRSPAEMELYFEDDLRVDLQSLLGQVKPEHLKELIPYYHRNSKEARLLKWLLARKGKNK